MQYKAISDASWVEPITKWTTKLSFYVFTLSEKVSIKRKGRPLPDIQIFQPGINNNKQYIMRFYTEGITRHLAWLCGCEVKNAVLFSLFIIILFK